MTGSNLQAISALLQAVKGYTDETIEASVIEYISQESAMKFVYEGEFEHFQDKADRALVNKFKAKLFPVNAEFVIEFFEALLDQDNITANGIVFTPQYIANYIFDVATKTYEKCARGVLQFSYTISRYKGIGAFKRRKGKML